LVVSRAKVAQFLFVSNGESGTLARDNLHQEVIVRGQAMLIKLNRIKNLGVFTDYSWDAQLPHFERFNVIYGDNGSGKTTFSRLLDCLKTGAHDEYPTLEYRIESVGGRNPRPAGRQENPCLQRRLCPTQHWPARWRSEADPGYW
jgi:hypothetical protein